MKSKIFLPFRWIFNLGVKSGLPKYVSFLCFLQIGVLLIPEKTWLFFGLNAMDYLNDLPDFIQYYVGITPFKNSMFIFWLLSPFTFIINLLLILIHFNTTGYKDYLIRRKSRLEIAGKDRDYSASLGFLMVILLYIWATAINMKEPSFLGDFSVVENRFAMMIVHGSAVSLVIPMFLSAILIELRANLTIKKKWLV